MRKILGVAAAFVLATTTATAAQDGDDYEFILVNHSSVAVDQFNGYAGGEWSDNWLRYQVEPGEQRTLRFNENATDACEVRTRVTFTDDSYFEDVVNYCGITYVHVSNNRMWTE